MNERSLAYPVAPTDLDILRLSLAVKLLENLCDLLPFPIDTGNRSILELNINIVCLSESRRQIHELSFAHLDDFFGALPHVNLKVFEQVHRTLH